jgi:hypothetical protein
VLGHSKIGASRVEEGISVTLREHEYAQLRQTVALRGTVRMALVPLTFVWWAGLSVVLVLFSELPVAALFTLAVLAASFEAVHALHVGVERIGRYLQVCYEEAAADDSVIESRPRWETTAMAVGPALPGGGIDPLFTILYCCAAVTNVIPALLPLPTPLEISVIGALHVLFIVRVMRARIAAGRQRAIELEQFRHINPQLPTPNSQRPTPTSQRNSQIPTTNSQLPK